VDLALDVFGVDAVVPRLQRRRRRFFWDRPDAVEVVEFCDAGDDTWMTTVSP
jgi:hypothetical protein